ncbi:MAG: hypothetical protein D9V47_01085 [Clostridia bacterium]|nr:MAG: hypothetical protein D9V47_12395 [Clostridia bacterium]TDA70449.1 MAG: hypothetical protein D9V47_01085 [Clostridia bacterium]
MTAKLEGKITAKVSRQVYAELQTQARVQGLTMSELVRNILDEHLRNEAARLGVPVVEDAIRRVIEPHVDQLAGMLAHAGIAAGTAAWLNKALVNLLKDVDPDEAWDQAVARAKAGLRRSMRVGEQKEDILD